jgi:hypothetical protein
MSTSVGPPKYNTFELAEKAERSMRRAVRKLYEDRARNNDTVSIWRDSRVVIVPARELLSAMDTQGEEKPETDGSNAAAS